MERRLRDAWSWSIRLTARTVDAAFGGALLLADAVLHRLERARSRYQEDDS